MSRQGKILAAPETEGGLAQKQVAALCWRMHDGAPEVLLITSRDTGRWIVPKGWPMADRSAAATAAQEAWEEAGVRGAPAERSLGSYRYPKLYPDAAAQLCEVEVFALRVKGLSHHYPERRQRRRKWFSLEKAARKVGEPELRALILGFGGAEEPAEDSAPPCAAPAG